MGHRSEGIDFTALSGMRQKHTQHWPLSSMRLG